MDALQSGLKTIITEELTTHLDKFAAQLRSEVAAQLAEARQGSQEALAKVSGAEQQVAIVQASLDRAVGQQEADRAKLNDLQPRLEAVMRNMDDSLAKVSGAEQQVAIVQASLDRAVGQQEADRAKLEDLQPRVDAVMRNMDECSTCLLEVKKQSLQGLDDMKQQLQAVFIHLETKADQSHVDNVKQIVQSVEMVHQTKADGSHVENLRQELQAVTTRLETKADGKHAESLKQELQAVVASVEAKADRSHLGNVASDINALQLSIGNKASQAQLDMLTAAVDERLTAKDIEDTIGKVRTDLKSVQDAAQLDRASIQAEVANLSAVVDQRASAQELKAITDGFRGDVATLNETLSSDVRGCQAEVANLSAVVDQRVSAQEVKAITDGFRGDVATLNETLSSEVRGCQAEVANLSAVVDQRVSKHVATLNENLSSEVANLSAVVHQRVSAQELKAIADGFRGDVATLREGLSNKVSDEIFKAAVLQIQGSSESLGNSTTVKLKSLEDVMLEGLTSIQGSLDQSVSMKDLDTKLTPIKMQVAEMQRDIMQKDPSEEVDAQIKTATSQVVQKTQNECDTVRRLLDERVSHQELEASIPKILDVAERQVQGHLGPLQQRIKSVDSQLGEIYTTVEHIQKLMSGKVGDSPGAQGGYPGAMARIG